MTDDQGVTQFCPSCERLARENDGLLEQVRNLGGEQISEMERVVDEANAVMRALIVENARLAEVERLRAQLALIASFADSEATDASRRYDANLTDLASSISALRIVERRARNALEGPAG